MQNQSTANFINSIYPIETLLKIIFIILAIFNTQYTLLIAFVASLIAVLRVCKMPVMNQQYLNKVLANNHGQNILYIVFGSMGYINYLYYSPIVIFFAYGIAQFIKVKYPQNSIIVYCDLIRKHKNQIINTKHILEFSFFIYLILTLPFGFANRAIKAFLMAQFLLLKYKLNVEFRQSCILINQWILSKISTINMINDLYCKLSLLIYNFASKGLQAQ